MMIAYTSKSKRELAETFWETDYLVTLQKTLSEDGGKESGENSYWKALSPTVVSANGTAIDSRS